MTELEKIAYAKSFLDKLAVGINPTDGSSIPQEDVLHHPRLSKCFLYVSDLLSQMIREKSASKKTGYPGKQSKVRFHLTAEQLSQFRFSEEPISMAELHRRLDELVDHNAMRGLARHKIPIWLVGIGLLNPPLRENRTYAGTPTGAGKQMGLSMISYTNEYGEFRTVAFEKHAQQFVIDHLDAIAQVTAKDRTYQP